MNSLLSDAAVAVVDPSAVSLGTLLQVAELEALTGALRVGDVGEIHLTFGGPTDATCRSLAGLDAFFELFVEAQSATELRAIVNVGPDTAPETFRFVKNAWFAEDAPGRSRPELPAPLPAEEGGTHGVDPKVQVDLTLAQDSPLRHLGADAFQAAPREEPRRRRR